MKIGDKFIVVNNHINIFNIGEIVTVTDKIDGDMKWYINLRKSGWLFDWEVKPYDRIPVSDCIENSH